ncbi:hypothetical protein OPV22_019345 [Ensete ventricosum]|uniref:Nbr1 FW domain-containing protein n=1 Tax=Ensete ventricosum TaxID=4639 RepID=A0AAV8QMK5_ENSVE|nr:hypothetical protein OPV22_019345 [Ensete ventricosum]
MLAAVDLPFANGLHSVGHSNQRDDDAYNDIGRPFHRGIICDGCGMYPIIGRKTMKDYDFSKTSKEADFTRIDKIWRMQNNGTTRWPYRTQLVWAGGDKFANKDSFLFEIPVGGISVNKEVDVAVDLTSPAVPGRYFSHWRLASPFGKCLDNEFGFILRWISLNQTLLLEMLNPFIMLLLNPRPATLQGFSDRATNKKLLTKRGGSIKQA